MRAGIIYGFREAIIHSCCSACIPYASLASICNASQDAPAAWVPRIRIEAMSGETANKIQQQQFSSSSRLARIKERDVLAVFFLLCFATSFAAAWSLAKA
jgi:hypothetical protein